MRHILRQAASGLVLLLSCAITTAAPALTVLGKDFTFPNKIEGLPSKLSDFKDLQINHFTTSDGVKLAYWEAGKGKPLVFIPGWSANGAEFFNVMYLLSKHYHVYVLDPRNQGLSQHVEYGTRISRFATDLKELNDHLDFKKADYCGWSMGASVLWSYIDQYGTKSINKVAFIDEPPSIYSHADWTEKERLDAGAITSDAERMIDSFTSGKTPNSMIVNSQAMKRAMLMDSPYFQNSESFAQAFVMNNIDDLKRVMFDHVTNDWRDVISKRIDVPTAIFTGVYSDSLQGQRWIHSVIPNSELHVYTEEEQGDHFLAFKNPVKFTAELDAFLKKPD
ncbi:Pimeloyl-ACP methyl ester carboxylesterase [Collimonas sp. OK607]|uniref:alpha/beta fold hydrolase n=1 Tax=Collimonas sp. OK607 TaxID=1798194 RepID=UPI0008F2F0CC|nr:alpha/beta hydrolase [Collimonas sp. OK607]SFB21150.1 Pimeloyl-ACP methyl ester carboxylesterase [Collimonas sp. OK607]